MYCRASSFGPASFALLLLSMTLTAAQSEEYVHPVPDHIHFPPVPPISTPGLCIRTEDCPEASFCRYRDHTCTPRLSVNSSCIFTDHCRPGLICAALDNTGRFKCHPFNQPGGPCDRSCTERFRCSDDGKQCISTKPDKDRAERIFQNSCAKNEIFRCRNSSSRCNCFGQEGKPCGNNGVICEGFCAGHLSPGDIAGTCLSSRKPQAICASNRQCDPLLAIYDDSEVNFCNFPDGPRKVGLCENRSSRLITLGAKCFRRRDLCDRARDLRCRYSHHLGRNACQHDPSVQADKFDNYCDPNSKLSRCARTPFNARRECRSSRIVPGRAHTGSSIPTRYPRCLRMRELIKVGQSCEQEFAKCPPGAECRVIPGIRYSTTLKYFGISGRVHGGTDVEPDLAAYCVEPRGKGEGCEEKFSTVCKDGLRCEAEKCVTGEKTLPSKNTHAHVGTECEGIPCTPGHACVPIGRGGRKVCVLPVKTMKRGQPCEPAALFERKCAPGLICMSNRNNIGPRKCRPPHSAGGYCEDNSWCKPGLRCPKFNLYERSRSNSRCYNEAGALGLGKPCNPQAGWRGKRCSLTEMRSDDKSLVMMRCLPKGHGFVCQIDVGPFGRCGSKLNRACGDKRLICSPPGICLPKNEV